MADQEPFAGMAKEVTLQDVTELLQELAIRLADIADSVGNLTPDAAGRLRVTAEAVANMVQVGGYAANQQIVAQTQMNEACLRQNVVIS